MLDLIAAPAGPSLNPRTTSHTTTNNPAKDAPSHPFRVKATSGLSLHFQGRVGRNETELSQQNMEERSRDVSRSTQGFS